MIRAVEVGVSFGRTPILQQVSLEVGAGELLALVGPNGAGKSTLLAVLSGDRAPDAGTVELGGRPLRQWRPGDLARHRAVLLQDNRVSFGFTARQVVEMGRSPWLAVADPAADEAAIAAAMAQTQTTAFAQRRFPELSGGERARVCLARVLAQDTPVLFLDEPTAALDLRHQEEVLQIARQRARAGCCVVVVVHDLSVAAAYADRVAVVDQGRLAALGPPREVFTTELVEQVYATRVHLTDDPHGNLLITPERCRG